jgi:general secretion pathway protein B
MSYILDALKKADRERNLGDVPDLEAAHWGVRRPSRASHWPWAVAALLLFNAALLVYLLGRDDPETSGGTAAVNQPPAAPSAQAPQRAGQPLQRLEQPVRDAPPERRARVNFPPPPVAGVSPERPARRSPAASAVAPPVVESALPLTAGGADSKLPEWGELPLEFRSGFPLPRIDVHVYAEEPAKRFVLIDLKKYREGDTLDNGATLERIAPRSIELRYQGTRFRVDQ